MTRRPRRSTLTDTLFPSPTLFRSAGPAHLLTIAPTRTGKGVGTIIPNLLDYPGPVVYIDPKGENARITAHYRARFGPVHVLDPFGVTGMVGAARSEEHTSELQSLMRISYAVFCLKQHMLRFCFNTNISIKHR